jgi:hypothetical protein
MSVTVKSFRQDFSQEFGDNSRYPNSAIGYWLQVASLMLNQAYWGVPSATADAPPTTLIDLATELFVAHNLVLEKQAVDAASRGGDPGVKMGMITNKSVGGVSIGYSVSEVIELDGGYYNATTFGQRFLRLARFKGSGPIQIGVGVPPLPFLAFNSSGQPWGGPFPGIMPSDTGFG